MQAKLTGLRFFKATLKLFKRGVSGIIFQVPGNISQIFGPENDKLSVSLWTVYRLS